MKIIKTVENVSLVLAIEAMLIAMAAYVAFVIYVHVKYTNTPISELPAWASWFLFGRQLK